VAECKLTVAFLAQGRGSSVIRRLISDEGKHRAIDALGALLSPRRDGRQVSDRKALVAHGVFLPVVSPDRWFPSHQDTGNQARPAAMAMEIIKRHCDERIWQSKGEDR
jgi:hypothetical protein